jgi:hypothetical protein
MVTMEDRDAVVPPQAGPERLLCKWLHEKPVQVTVSSGACVVDGVVQKRAVHYELEVEITAAVHETQLIHGLWVAAVGTREPNGFRQCLLPDIQNFGKRQIEILVNVKPVMLTHHASSSRSNRSAMVMNSGTWKSAHDSCPEE